MKIPFFEFRSKDEIDDNIRTVDPTEVRYCMYKYNCESEGEKNYAPCRVMNKQKLCCLQ